jgi:hypothetical protein
MSNLLVKHSRTFSPAKLRYLSEITHRIYPQLPLPLAKAILGLNFWANKAVDILP